MNNKINVLELRDSPWLDGPGRTILETAAKINSEKFGYFIGGFCNKDLTNNPFIDSAIKRNLNIFRINEFSNFDITVFAQIKHIIKSEKINIIHTHETRSDIIGLIVGKLLGIPVITTLHGWIENNFKSRLLTRLDKSLLRFFDHVITVSNKMKEQVLLDGVAKENVTALNNALVLENYHRNSEDQSFRKEIKVGDQTLLVANIGRLSPEKGQTDFIKSAKLVINQNPDVRFILIGIGNDQANLESLVKQLGFEEKILFLGYRNDMINIYNNIDLVVQSSFTEGMPNVILEALAMEVPVIATDVGGTSEVVINNVTGVLVKPGNPREISTHILKFIENKQIYRQMAINGKNLVNCEFGFDVRTKKLSNIYETIYYTNRNRQ